MSNETKDDLLRPTTQEDFELDPRAHDSSANENVDNIAIDASSLYEQSLEQTRMAITLTDPHKPDNPIIYCNQAFVELTGYDRKATLGRNCNFLQGPETDQQAIDDIRKAIEAREVRVIEILNYRSDGSTFWNALHVGPVYNDAGELTHYYGSQWDITEIVAERKRSVLQKQVAEELQHRTGNLFSVITSILRVTARSETDVKALVSKVEGRLQALRTAHEISISKSRNKGEASDLHELISTILDPYRTDNSRRVVLSGEMLGVAREAVTPLGLMLHELATNALKYGAFSTAKGEIEVAWKRKDESLELTWTETGGPLISEPSRVGNGSRITEGVLRAIGAELIYDWPPGGLRATLTMPLQGRVY